MTEPQQFTPYRSANDLLKLRSLFFAAESSPLALEDGIRTVHTWHTKGPVPHGINVTALIISIQLNDPRHNLNALTTCSSLYALRSAYAEAIITMVNGLLDPFQGDVAMPVLMLAAKIGLPNYFVEFRHAATHDVLPSLGTLRFVGEKALVWLEEHFWTDQNLLRTPVVTGEPVSARRAHTVSRSRCILLIKLYKGNQKRGINNASALAQLQALSQDLRQHGVLGKLLLNSRILFSDTSGFSKLKSLYLPLLNVFLEEFILHLLFGTVSRCFENQDSTTSRCILHSWIAYFVTRLPDLSYPISSLHTFESPLGVKDYLRKYIGMLDGESALYLQSLLDGKPIRTFSTPPLLEDILKRGSAVETEAKTSLAPGQNVAVEANSSVDEEQLKRPKHELPVFGTFSAWKPVPFGVYPHS